MYEYHLGESIILTDNFNKYEKSLEAKDVSNAIQKGTHKMRTLPWSSEIPKNINPENETAQKEG